MATHEPYYYGCSRLVIKLYCNNPNKIKDQLPQFTFQLIHYGDLLAPTLTNDAGELVSDPLPPLPLDYTELIWLVDMCAGGGSMLAFSRPGDDASARWCCSADGFASFVKSLGAEVRLKTWGGFDTERTKWFEALQASHPATPGLPLRKAGKRRT